MNPSGIYACDLNELAMRATSVTLHAVPDDMFDDWIVRGDDGRELGHFPTREAAELAAEAFMRDRGGVLVIHLPDGRCEQGTFRGAGWRVGLRGD